MNDRASATRPGLRGALSSLDDPQFRWLYLGNLAFFLAMGGQQVARSWLAFRITGSEFALGLVSFAVAVPMLIVGPFGGVIADRFDRRTLIAAGQSLVLGGELSILALLVTGRLRFWHLLTLAVLMGCVFPFVMPARQAIVANLVGRARLTNAMALNMAGMNATRVLGPAAAGLLIGTLGIEGTYAVDTALYLLGLACLLRVRPCPPDADGRTDRLLRSVVEGFRYALDDRLVLALLFFGLVPMFLTMPFQTLLVVFAEEVWSVGATGLGLLSAAAGLGGVVGSVIVAFRSDSQRRVRSMLTCMVGFGSLLAAFAASPWFGLALPLVFVANICASIFGTLNNTAIQLLIPDRVRGRISSFLLMSFSLPMLGTLPLSALAELSGAPLAVGAASLLAVVVALVFYAGSPALRGLDASVRRALVE